MKDQQRSAKVCNSSCQAKAKARDTMQLIICQINENSIIVGLLQSMGPDDGFVAASLTMTHLGSHLIQT